MNATLTVEEQLARLKEELRLIREESERLRVYMKQYGENSDKHTVVYNQIKILMLQNSKFGFNQRVRITDDTVEKQRSQREAEGSYVGDAVKYKGRACYVHRIYFNNDLTLSYELKWEGKTTGQKTNYEVYSWNGWPEDSLEDFPKQ